MAPPPSLTLKGGSFPFTCQGFALSTSFPSLPFHLLVSHLLLSSATIIPKSWSFFKYSSLPVEHLSLVVLLLQLNISKLNSLVSTKPGSLDLPVSVLGITISKSVKLWSHVWVPSFPTVLSYALGQWWMSTPLFFSSLILIIELESRYYCSYFQIRKIRAGGWLCFPRDTGYRVGVRLIIDLSHSKARLSLPHFTHLPLCFFSSCIWVPFVSLSL